MNNYLSINIPVELQQYTKSATDSSEREAASNVFHNFGVKIVKDEQGNLKYTAYYSDSGELVKKIYYEGSSVSLIEHYRNNKLYSQEKCHEGRMTKKSKFSRMGKTLCSISYVYNRNEQIIAIKKSANGSLYVIKYGYDELMRVNSRVVSINNEQVIEQSYRYDILDRVVHYKDSNQTIQVNKINPKNELISYTVIDNMGNVIQIVNKFLCSEYLGTEIDLNGHKTTVIDNSYLDNIMLKKPFTSEDDLDFVLTNMYIPPPIITEDKPPGVTKRISSTDIVDAIINDSINNMEKPLPISMRKQTLILSKAS